MKGHVRDMAHPSIGKLVSVNCVSFSLVMDGAGIIGAMLQRLAYVVIILVLCSATSWAGDSVLLDVHVEPAGGVRAKATILFPVEPAVIQRLLTDYAHWPDLFEVRMRIAELREQDGNTLTDIRIDHSLLPGERRLLCESHALVGGGLLTELRGGDFKQYRRQWKLAATEGGRQTKADFELLVEIDTIVPDWMIALAMRQELEAHFRIVKEKAVARATQGR